MPTRVKPQINHQRVNFSELVNRLEEEYRANKETILERVGFYREFGDPGAATYTGAREANELIRELAGIVAMAAVILIDAGFKPANKLIATLEAIIEDPKLFYLDTTEPEAQGVVGACYQRADEPAGTYWSDLEFHEANEIYYEWIRAAARNGIAEVTPGARRGRPFAWHVVYLVSKLRPIFLRFNDRITRKSVWSSRGDGDLSQTEEGPFFLFVETVLAPLTAYLDGPSDSGSSSPSGLSSEYIVKRAIAYQI
jgi:hypothetical protein